MVAFARAGASCLQRGVRLFDENFSLESPTGALLNVYHARARTVPRGSLLVLHGLAEHAGRYARFAGEMAEQGFHVYAHDHRGHGSTSAPDAPLKRFASSRGGPKLVADAFAVQDHADIEHHGLPVLVLGHSMGGLVAVNYAAAHGRDLAGLAVWNSNLTLGLEERVAVLALKVEKALKGSDVPSALFMRATIDAWSQAIEPRRTPSDWLTHDADAVDRYIADPLCGWAPTVSMAEDLVALVKIGNRAVNTSALPPALPVHLLGGTADPATANGAALETLAALLRVAGSRDVTTTIVPGARHETLHETEPYRSQGLASFHAWVDRILPR
ncbi:lysophospholipase [Aureimonas sp. SA4125]|uniref:alpha/beta fold hydrolase n=1 Tax=Aureimonas sp. SA4125 TaxID=2826993 RepID=UPI001CC62833|nr:alpha/beta hydrolase [Aureimonas sp. SA4125]BDA85628.1 lysophospholipase [Aureimonas sp. SA4125]